MKKEGDMKKLFSIILIFLFLTSCASLPQRLSSTPLPAEYKELGETSCKACSYLLFGFIPIKFKNMPVRAHNCAVELKNGSQLINPTISESWYWTPLGPILCTTVSGMVIK